MTVYQAAFARVAAKVETTPGTLNAPAGTDANVLLEDVKFDTDYQPAIRNPGRMNRAGYPHLVGKQLAKLNCKIPIQGAEGLATAPNWGKWLQACGFSETITPTTGPIVYKPASTVETTLSADIYLDGKRFRVRGMAGDATINFQSGKPVYIEASFMAVMDETNPETDDAFAGVATFPTVAQPIWMGSAVSVLSQAVDVASLSLKIGNRVQERESASSQNGVKHYWVGGRDSKIEIDPERYVNATYASTFRGKLNAKTVGTVTWALGPATGAGANLAFSARCQIESVGNDARGDIAVEKLGLRLVGTTVDDEDDLTITLA